MTDTLRPDLAFVSKLELLESNTKKITKAFLEDNENYILCLELETSESNLMSVLLAQTLRTLKQENILKPLFVEKYSDFDGIIKLYNHEQNDWAKVTQVTDLWICKVEPDELLYQYSGTSKSRIVKQKSNKIIFIVNDSEYFVQAMMNIGMENILTSRFTEMCQLWDEGDVPVPKQKARTSTCKDRLRLQADDKQPESLYKKVQCLLSRLTTDNFEVLAGLISELPIDDKERLQGVVELICEKVISEHKPDYTSACAMLCKELQCFQVSDNKGKNVPFRTILVTWCQIKFETWSVSATKWSSTKKEIDECLDPGTKEKLQLDVVEYDRFSMNYVALMWFLGELFKHRMLTGSIIKRCARTLLYNKDEVSLKCLCELLFFVGKELELKFNLDLDDIFDEMEKIAVTKTPPISVILQDVINLRNSDWVQSRKV